MNVSRRERLVAIIAAGVAALFLLDRYLLTPYLNYRTSLARERIALTQRLADDKTVMERKIQLLPQWQSLTKAGLQSDPDKTYADVTRAVREWSDSCGLTLGSLKPDRRITAGPMGAVTFQATGQGTMNSISRFLFRIETAALPLRVEEVQINSRREGTDALDVQLRLAALYLAPQNTNGKKPR